MLPLSGWAVRAGVILLATGMVGASALWYFSTRQPPIPDRPLRIGFEPNPPLQIRADGGFSGLAVETIDAAAKRARVRLQWVETGTSSDEAFGKGLVDLWPLMADLPDRRKHVHLTLPWLHSDHVLVFRAGSVPPDREFAGGIAVFRMPLHVRLIGERFPQAQAVQLKDTTDVLKSVCEGAAGAAFLETRVAMTALKEKPAECDSVGLHIHGLPDLNIEGAVASSFEAAAAADAIRREIGGMFRDGTLADLMTKYSYYGLDDNWATYELMQAAERARWIAWGIGALAIVIALVLWRTSSLRQSRRAAVALRESEQRFRAIFDQAAVGVAQIDLEGKVTLVNDRYCAVLGYTREELLGTTLLDKTHSDDIESMEAKVRQLLAGEISAYSLEMRYGRKDAVVTWVRLYGSLVRDGEGRPKNFIAVVEDITERKRTEAALQESEERFRNMADTAPVMIWVAGPDKLCTFFNKTWLDFRGRTMEQELGNGWTTGVHPDDLSRCYEEYSSAIDARENFHIVCRVLRADGEYRSVLCAGVPRFAPGGLFAGYIGSDIDITELKRTQDETFEMQKLESMSVLTGGIAHDFNNLLGGILAEAELVEADLPAGSSTVEEIRRIKAVAIRGAEIVRQLMIYSGQDKAILERLDVSQLVEEMLALLNVSISKHVALRTDLPENLPSVWGNAPQIRQMVMNLVINASEAIGEEDGLICVTTSWEREHDLAPRTLTNRPKGDCLRLEISDTGPGMTTEVRAKIFDPFYTTKFAGRGLGLAVVQAIVRDHGGAIELSTTSGHGTAFQIHLPCAGNASEHRRITTSTPVERIPNGGGTVLLVEDEDTLRFSISKMLRRQGFSVVEASDGSNAINLFRGHKNDIDVVLLDLTIPGTSSREVILEARRLRPNIKVVLTSAYGQEMARESLGEPDINGFIRKPFQLAELVRLLQDTISPTDALSPS